MVLVPQNKKKHKVNLPLDRNSDAGPNQQGIIDLGTVVLDKLLARTPHTYYAVLAVGNIRDLGAKRKH